MLSTNAAHVSPNLNMLSMTSSAISPLATQLERSDVDLSAVSIPTPRRSPRLQQLSLSEAGNIGRSTASPITGFDTIARVLPFSEAETAPAVTQAASSSQRVDDRVPELGAVIVDEPCESEMMCKVYTFLHGLNRQKLRAVCKRLRCRLAGNKQELLFRSYLFLAHLDEQKGDVVSFISSRVEFEGAQKFFADNELATLNLRLVTSKTFMLKHLKAAGDKINDAEVRNTSNETEANNAQQDPNFTHSEFSMFFIVMRDDERAKEALFALRVSHKSFSDLFWIRAYAGIHTGTLSRHSATTLKDHFKRARADFTKVYVKWRYSGQNDPDRFVYFLSYNKGQLYSSCKRAYIIFLCCQLGTPHPNTLFSDSIMKSIPHGGQEEGISVRSQASGEEVNDVMPGEQKRRRKSNANILEDIQDASRSIIEASSAVTKRFQHTNNKAGSTMSLKQDTSALHLLNVKSKCYNELQAAYDNLQSAMVRGDPVLIGFAQASLDEAKKVCEEVCNGKQRSDAR